MPGDIAYVAYDPALQRGCHGVEGFACGATLPVDMRDIEGG